MITARLTVGVITNLLLNKDYFRPEADSRAFLKILIQITESRHSTTLITGTRFFCIIGLGSVRT